MGESSLNFGGFGLHPQKGGIALDSLFQPLPLLVAHGVSTGIQAAGDQNLAFVIFGGDQNHLAHQMRVGKAGIAEKFEFADLSEGAFPADFSGKQSGTQIQLTVIIEQFSLSQAKALTSQADIHLGPVGEVDQVGKNNRNFIENPMNKSGALFPRVVLIKSSARTQVTIALGQGSLIMGQAFWIKNCFGDFPQVSHRSP